MGRRQQTTKYDAYGHKKGQRQDAYMPPSAKTPGTTRASRRTKQHSFERVAMGPSPELIPPELRSNYGPAYDPCQWTRPPRIEPDPIVRRSPRLRL